MEKSGATPRTTRGKICSTALGVSAGGRRATARPRHRPAPCTGRDPAAWSRFQPAYLGALGQHLSDRFRVVRFDLPGFGLTGPDPTNDYSDARAVAVLAALMDTLSVQHASLIGNSMGGKLAWQFAAEHPDRVDKLVLISPDGFASPGFEYGKKAEVPTVAKAVAVHVADLDAAYEPCSGLRRKLQAERSHRHPLS